MKKFIFLFVFALSASLFLGSTAFGQITQRGSSTSNTATGATLNLAKPTGLALNDVMIVSISQGENAGGSLSNATADGWSLVQGTSFGVSGNLSHQATILYKVANAADVAASGFDFTVSNSGSDVSVGTLVAFFNVSPTTPIEATGTWGTGSGTTVTAPDISTTSANAGLMMFAFTGDNNGSTNYSGWSSPLTEKSDASNTGNNTQDVAVGSAFGLQVVAGSSGNKTVTQSSDPWAGILVALKPATPVASLSPAAQTISTGGSVAFTTATTFFPSGGSYTYTWTVTPNTGVTVPGGNSSTKNITFANAGSYTVSVQVTHSTGASATSNIATVNVSAPNSSIGCNGSLFISYTTSGSADPTNTTSISQLAYNGSIFTASGYAVNPTGIGFNGMGLNAVDGFIYAVRYPASGAAARLVKVGTPGAGNVNDLGVISGLATGETVYAGAFDANGDYYITAQNSTAANSRLLKITHADIANGLPFTATQIGSTNTVYSTIADLAINPVTGQLVGAANGGVANYLYPGINKATGVPGSAIGGTLPSSTFFAGLFYNEAGSLFGYRSDGEFYGINTASGAITSAGSTTGYQNADGCNCSFRVGHTMTRGSFCPSVANPNPDFPVTMTLLNNSGSSRSGLTLTLDISDPNTRFRFVQAGTSTPADPSAIASALFAAGLLPNANASNVVFSTVAPATGTNYNKVIINNLIAPYPSTVNHKVVLNVEFYTTGGIYSPVNFQSVISNLPSGLGGTDLSDNTSNISGPIGPDAPTIISFTDCGNISLPVKLSSFTGSTKDGVNRLNWVVQDEINFDHYELERSVDGRNFSVVSITAATQSMIVQQYQQLDNVIQNTENIFYYRLKMVDLDGSYKYSNVIMIRKSTKDVDGISISPNPVVNADAVTARISSAAAGTVNLSVIDMAGRVLLRQQSPVIEGINSIAITNLDRLQPGVYLLKMNNGEKTESTKFTVIR